MLIKSKNIQRCGSSKTFVIIVRINNLRGRYTHAFVVSVLQTYIINCKSSLAFLHIDVKHNSSISSHPVINCTLNYQSQDGSMTVVLKSKYNYGIGRRCYIVIYMIIILINA